MGDEQGSKALVEPGSGEPVGLLHPGYKAVPGPKGCHKEQTQAHTGDNIRIHHGDVVDGEQRIAPAALHIVKADGSEGACHSSNESGQHRNQQGGVDALHDQPILEELYVPFQGEALPYRAAVARIKGEDDQQQDGGVQKQKHQSHEQAAAEGIFLVHSSIASSSPSPKRFITYMQMMTMTIITRAMALPR